MSLVNQLIRGIRKIEQNETPELGNDFNDNYLNPR